MLARTQQINLTAEELDAMLTGYTDNGVIDTIPEILDEIDKIERGGGTPTDMLPMSNLDIERLLK